MVDGLQARLAEKNVSLIINTSTYDIDLEYEQARLLVERGVESVVLVGALHRPATLAMLDQKRIAYVFTYTSTAAENAAAVGFDNEKAGRTAARYLLDLGHKRLAMIAGITQDNDRARGRRDGFLHELAAAGIDLDAVPVTEGAYRLDDGVAGMRSLMAAAPPPTAVFCGSDILAAGAIKFCHQAGIAVPRGVSIVGFDNLEIAELTSPEMTTLEVPARDMGRLAADYILASPLQRKHLRQRELAIRLVVRGTTRPAPRIWACSLKQPRRSTSTPEGFVPSVMPSPSPDTRDEAAEIDRGLFAAASWLSKQEWLREPATTLAELSFSLVSKRPSRLGDGATDRCFPA
jgi:LacI family transcriptional regulator